MCEERIRLLSRRNMELAEKVTQLEQLKNHWYQELIGCLVASRSSLEDLISAPNVTIVSRSLRSGRPASLLLNNPLLPLLLQFGSAFDAVAIGQRPVPAGVGALARKTQ